MAPCVSKATNIKIDNSSIGILGQHRENYFSIPNPTSVSLSRGKQANNAKIEKIMKKSRLVGKYRQSGRMVASNQHSKQSMIYNMSESTAVASNKKGSYRNSSTKKHQKIIKKPAHIKNHSAVVKQPKILSEE